MKKVENIMFEKLTIPNTIAAGPGPGNTDPRVLEQFSKAGIADHMHPDVLRGMKECKFMLRDVWGTKNMYTFGVAGTGWSGLDAMISAVKPGDKVVAFVNGTFSGIDALSLRMKAATEEELAANPLDPMPKVLKLLMFHMVNQLIATSSRNIYPIINLNGHLWHIMRQVQGVSMI